jgi:hypothetical protein
MANECNTRARARPYFVPIFRSRIICCDGIPVKILHMKERNTQATGNYRLRREQGENLIVHINVGRDTIVVTSGFCQSNLIWIS